MNFNHDLGLIDTLLTIDTSISPPLGGQVNSLVIVGTGAVQIPAGDTSERPVTPTAAMTRYNSDLTALEYFDGVTWRTLSVGGGTVTSVAATGSTGLSVGGSPVTSSGTLTFTLDVGLQNLATYSSTGLVVATGPNTWGSATITGTAGNISVTDGNGIAGNPTLDLVDAGTPVTASFVKITTDAKGRVTATTPVVTSDITTLVDSTYVNVTGDTMSSGANLTFTGGGEVLGLPAVPTDPTSATSKAYVDSILQGLDPKASARVATTTAQDLSTDFAAGQIIDGITLVLGDRVLIKDQALPEENGIYVVTAGTPTRATDMDTWSEVPSTFTFVEEGTVNADTGWVVVSDTGGTIDITPMVWVQFSGAGSYLAGTGLTLTGNTFSITAPVSTALGGTGLTSIGTANQLLSVNTTDTALEYKTATAGAGISIIPTTGVLTITNTGVTSISGTSNQIATDVLTGDVTLGIPPIFIAPGSVEVTTTLAVDVSQTINPSLTSGNIGVGLIIYGNTADDLQDWILNDGSTVAAKVDPVGDFYIYRGLGDSTNSLGTSGQILTSTGSATTWADLSTSAVTTFSAGATGLTPSSPTSGAVTLAGTLATTHGGTGLTTIGTANQFLSVNTSATGLEYKTITAGTGISVTPAAGSLTINNTGVTSVALAAPSIFSVSGSPVTTTGTLTLTLATQSANTVFAGPTTGSPAAPTFRALGYTDLPIKLYAENPSTPTAPLATGTNSIAEGSGSSATATQSYANGEGANAQLFGQKAFANGSFATTGDAQYGLYVLRTETSNNTATELFLDGTAGTQRLVVGSNSVWTFDILITSRRTDAVGGGAGYRFVGVIKKDATAASTTFVGTPSKTVLGETDAPWDVMLTANTTNGDLRVSVTGQNAKTIRWVAVVQTVEVTN